MFADRIMSEKLTLEQQIARKEAQLAKLKNQHRTCERKKEARRLIYHGRLLERLIERGVINKQQYERALDEFLIRNYDREFFGLSLNPEEPQSQPHRSSPTAAVAGDGFLSSSQPQAGAVSAPPSPPVTQGKRLYEHRVSEEEFLS